MKNLVLFDFDYTLYDGDSMLDFVRFVHGNKLYWFLALTIPHIIIWKLGLTSSTKPKERLLFLAFRTAPAKKLEAYAKEFGREIDHKLYPKARQVLHQHMSNESDDVFIVSASCYLWLKPWCDEKKLGLIATGLEVSNDKYTGRLSSANCIQKEKETRIQKEIDLSEYTDVIVYGKGRGDREMLALATKPYADISF